MPFEVASLGMLYGHDFDAVIDVRSPSEYAEDHVPGAVSLPVFSDEERARVGTMYVQESPFLARKLGAAILARNAAAHIEGPLAHHDGGWRPLVYCWRGGQRSGAFATILRQIGWRVETIEGGYQSYRRRVVETLYDRDMASRVILLDGFTGTAKTDLLPRLADRGLQVMDLEGMANHRGSVLGGLGGQPSQKGFETRLAQSVVGLDPDRPVVVEAESSKIGALNLPPRLFAAMKAAPRIEVRAPVTARAAYLARAYVDVTEDLPRLVERLERLTRLRGKAQVEAWIAAAQEGRFEELAADLMVQHYDPAYAKSRARNDGCVVARVETEDLSEEALDRVADEVLRRVAEIEAGSGSQSPKGA